MSPSAGAHRTIIETGPGTIRRLCCDTGQAADGDLTEIVEAALGAIDDRVALVGERPVAVDSLWRTALRSLNCGGPDGRKSMALVHPSWWPPSRVGVVTAAAQTLADDVLACPRSWLLTRASDEERAAMVVVEIGERLVVLSGPEVVALPRTVEPDRFVEEAATVIGGMTRDMAAVVLIDAPSTVAGAPALATLIAGAARGSGETVVEIDDAGLTRLGRSAWPVPDDPS